MRSNAASSQSQARGPSAKSGSRRSICFRRGALDGSSAADRYWSTELAASENLVRPLREGRRFINPLYIRNQPDNRTSIKYYCI